jgi:hypothetical protein
MALSPASFGADQKYQYTVNFELLEKVPDELVQAVIRRADIAQSAQIEGYMPPKEEAAAPAGRRQSAQYAQELSALSIKKLAIFERLVPGEPVPEFGGMTPEQFARITAQVEAILFDTVATAGGVMTAYSHLTASLMLDIEEAAGTEAMNTVLDVFVKALRDQIDGQRKARQLQLERGEQPNHEHDRGLN